MMNEKKVVFEGANELTVDYIMSMVDDGYEFEIKSGKITAVIVPTACTV